MRAGWSARRHVGRRHVGIGRLLGLLAFLGVSMIVHAVPARADQGDFCAQRPGIGTAACTLSAGQAMVEVTAGGWEHARDAGSVGDDVTLADTLLRVGVGGGSEVQLGMTGYLFHRERDRLSGERLRVSGPGDATIGFRHNLGGSSSSGAGSSSGGDGPIAVEAFVTLPVGEPPLGDGRVAAGLLVPMEITLSDAAEIDLTPEVDLLPDEAGGGRHIAWGGVIGLSHAIGPSLTAIAEFAAFRDEEALDRSTDARIAGSLAWRAGRRLQVDVEFDAGVSHGAPDRAVLVGFARQFP